MAVFVDEEGPPPGWYATPEGRNKWHPYFRKLDEKRRQQRERATQLFEQAISTLGDDDAALVRRIFRGL